MNLVRNISAGAPRHDHAGVIFYEWVHDDIALPIELKTCENCGGLFSRPQVFDRFGNRIPRPTIYHLDELSDAQLRALAALGQVKYCAGCRATHLLLQTEAKQLFDDAMNDVRIRRPRPDREAVARERSDIREFMQKLGIVNGAMTGAELYRFYETWQKAKGEQDAASASPIM